MHKIVLIQNEILFFVKKISYFTRTWSQHSYSRPIGILMFVGPISYSYEQTGKILLNSNESIFKWYCIYF